MLVDPSAERLFAATLMTGVQTAVSWVVEMVSGMVASMAVYWVEQLADEKDVKTAACSAVHWVASRVETTAWWLDVITAVESVAG